MEAVLWWLFTWINVTVCRCIKHHSCCAIISVGVQKALYEGKKEA